jgi:UDP-N-acetyl-D-mannosaminuronate dehydrogenase
MSSEQRVVTLVVGLGEVGRPLYDILKRREPATIGIDVDATPVDGRVDIMHICFPFHDSDQFQSAVDSYVTKYAPNMVIINSTVVPGTTRCIESSSGVPCVYSPIRGKHAKMVHELNTYIKFLAATAAQATERARTHFESAGLQTETMSTPEALELAKLLETTYFGLLIAWAQEMNRFANTVNADYLEVGKFFREISYLPNVLFQPGFIGGHCVMPNIELLQKCFRSDFLEVVKKSNETRKGELAVQEQQRQGKRLHPLAMA